MRGVVEAEGEKPPAIRFGVMGSERRAGFATGVPERDKLEEIASHSIVEKVSNSGEI